MDNGYLKYINNYCINSNNKYTFKIGIYKINYIYMHIHINIYLKFKNKI